MTAEPHHSIAQVVKDAGQRLLRFFLFGFAAVAMAIATRLFRRTL